MGDVKMRKIREMQDKLNQLQQSIAITKMIESFRTIQEKGKMSREEEVGYEITHREAEELYYFLGEIGLKNGKDFIYHSLASDFDPDDEEWCFVIRIDGVYYTRIPQCGRGNFTNLFSEEYAYETYMEQEHFTAYDAMTVKGYGGAIRAWRNESREMDFYHVLNKAPANALPSLDSQKLLDAFQKSIGENAIEFQRREDSSDNILQNQNVDNKEVDDAIEKLTEETIILDDEIYKLNGEINEKRKKLELKKKLEKEVDEKRKKREDLIKQLKQLADELDTDKQVRECDENKVKTGTDNEFGR